MIKVRKTYLSDSFSGISFSFGSIFPNTCEKGARASVYTSESSSSFFGGKRRKCLQVSEPVSYFSSDEEDLSFTCGYRWRVHECSSSSTGVATALLYCRMCNIAAVRGDLLPVTVLEFRLPQNIQDLCHCPDLHFTSEWLPFSPHLESALSSPGPAAALD